MKDILKRHYLCGKTSGSTFLIFCSFFLLILSTSSEVFAQEQACIYKTQDGVIKQASSLYDVPLASRKHARCFKAGQKSFLAKPQNITLKGNIRREDISTSIGRMKIRWPRKVENFFGRTPMRAITDVAETVSRALKTSAFPSFVKDLDIEWQIVFLDGDLPSAEIPAKLVNNCHPGWMTPPSNIYIVAQRVAGGCGRTMKSKNVADSDLAEVLLHEFGHAVENDLLRSRFRGDSARAEGFATWFEMFASRYSSVMSQGKIRRKTYKKAKEAIQRSPSFHFTGTSADYARSSMYFEAIVKKSGVNGLMRAYKKIALSGVDFFTAVKQELYLDRNKLDNEIVKLLK